MDILHLTLKKKYFVEIAGGEKPYEYRLVKPYWTKRLEGRHFDEVHFRLGYARDAPFMRIEVRGIEQAMFQGALNYKIILGRILEVRNYEGVVVNGYL